MLAEVTSLAATDVAGDIHLSARLCEWEVARTQADLGISTEHLASEGEEHLLEVGEAYVLVHIETFYLVEEAVGTGADSLVAVYAARAENADRWLMSLHVMCLIVGGMTAQEHILGYVIIVALLDEEGILHVTGWMIGCKVEHSEHVLVVVNLRTLIEGESHTAEDVDDLVLYNSQRMACTQSHRISRTGQVDVVAACVSLFHLLLESVDLGKSSLLQFVDFDTNLFFLVAWHIAEVGHEGIDFTLFAEILDAKLFYFFCVLSSQRIYFFQEFFYFF